MGNRKITVRQSAAYGIARAAWFIESKGLVATAEKFSDAVYNSIETLGNILNVHALCREPQRNLMGMKCIRFKKYTIVFLETDEEIIICEFLPSKLIHW
jgi:hypothetical protein